MIGEKLFFTIGGEALLILGVVVVVYALLGKPLFAVLGALTLLLYAATDPPMDFTMIFAEMSTIAEIPIFVTVPLFVLAGMLLAESQAPVRLVNVCRGFFGWMPGGIAIVATVSCALFTAFTGASGVTIVALGGILYPMLRREGYPDGFTLGLITTGGSLGSLFPPSLPIIIYGLIGKVDIDRLFIAGLVPGLFLVAVIALYCVGAGIRARVPRHAFIPRTALKALWAALPELPIPVIIVGGIYSGLITATEAAAVTAFYVLVVEVAVYRDIKVRDLPSVLLKTAELVGAIIVILSMALGLKNYLIQEDIPQKILAAIAGDLTGRVQFLLLLNAFLLVAGALLEGFSAILVLVPLVLPLALNAEVGPIHLGIIFLTNLEVGFLFPPIGLNLFLSSLRFRRPVIEVSRIVLPFLGLRLACLAVITYVPSLSEFLLRALKK